MFKEGDKVRVNPNAPTRESFNWNSASGMDETRGVIGEIIFIREGEGYMNVAYVDTGITGKWNYRFSDLEKITDENMGALELTRGGAYIPKPAETVTGLMESILKERLKTVMAQREEICTAFIAKHGCEPDEIKQVETRNEDGSTEWYLTKKLQEKTTMKPELKFEIGTKYNLKHFCSNPYIYLDDARKHGFEVECRHVFRDCEGDIIEIEEADIESVEEYREPYKKTIEGWIGYDDGERESTIPGLLLNKRSSTYIHSKKEEVGGLWKHQKFVRITLEEIPHG